MDSTTLMLLVVLAVGFALYMQIQKTTQNIDANEALNGQSYGNFIEQDDSEKYKAFCDKIDQKIRELRGLLDDELIDGKKDGFLEKLSQISKKLIFVQTMNNNASKEKWENELFSLLVQIEEAINFGVKDAQNAIENMRNDLKQSFENL
ncbi:hypothetical protein [Campylobacter suis]|uniref:Thioester dehydrase family protein n=1 Tax=Campylobacter suis TaxID=2790657 RepID=A0ABN7K8A7_9BACT|nr:hypothetical protein [Campylobacter suis]CAD7287125.1 hypothetical protein LMG8286_00756 [Campylobacter suis]